MRLSKGYCISCDRDVYRSPGDDNSCPVCSSTLTQSEGTAVDGSRRPDHHRSELESASGSESA